MLLVVLVATPVISATCDPVITGCTACADADVTKCVQCSAGYKLTFSTGTCTLCDAGTGKAEDGPNQSADTICDVICSRPCNICGATETTCLACADGYRSLLVSSAKTCVACSGGKGIAAEASPSTTDTTCELNCVEGCNGCGVNTNVCLTCAVGYKSLMYNGDKICLSCGGGRGRAAETDPSTSQVTTTCTIICAPQCQSCGASRTSCASCSAGFYMSAANTCTSCPAGFGKPADTQNPAISLDEGVTECNLPCHVSCNACFGSAADNCLNCNVNYNFDGVSTCNICQDGRTKPSDTLIIPYATTSCYQYCHGSCTTCKSSSDGDCKKCAASYWWAGSGACTMCPEQFTKPADAIDNPAAASTSADCTIGCAPNCKQCTSASTGACTSCYAGYYRTSSTCTVCPDGRGKGTDSDPVVNNASSAYWCSTTCHASCRVCSDSSSTGCMACKAGYYYSAAGTCSFCPVGKTKPKDDPFPVAPVPDTTCTDSCHGSCKYCKGTTTSDCMACSGGYYWSGSSSCTECPPTKGRAPDAGENIGAGLNPSTACGITCNIACKVCQGTAATDCNKCSAGFYMSAANTCTICPAGFGKVVDSTDTFPTPSSTSGVSECDIVCATGCRTCFGTQSTECLSCSAGYFYAGGNSCTPCATGKGKPADTTVITVGTTSDLACTATCHASCLTCTGSTSSDCVKCAAGFYLSAAGTCTICPAGSGKVADASVLSPGASDQCNVVCDSSCRTCSATGSNGCLACAAGLFYFGGGVCNFCAPGKGKPADTTVITVATTSDAACTATCDSSCARCQGTGATDCLSCRGGFYYSAANTCTMCSLGFGKPSDPPLPTVQDAATACTLTCHSSCNTCVTTDPTGCLNCNSGFWWAGAGTCTACANGKTKGPDASYTTAASTEAAACTNTCNAGCQMCSGSDPTCVFCAATFYYSAAGVCSPCASGRGKAADSAANAVTDGSTICVTCAPGCESCTGTGPTDCVKCSAGFFLSAAGTCSMCPAGFGKIADSTIPAAPSADSGTTECGITCDTSCRTCSATGTAGCLNCAAGFWWAGSGTCTQCGDTTGKAAHTDIPSVVETAASCTATCDSSCLICSASTPGSCIKCQAGYFLSAAGTCTMCPAGKGKLHDTAFPTVATGDVSCTITCDATCRTCLGTAVTECLNCGAGYFWQGSGTCAKCTAGTGKPLDSAIPTTAGSQALCTDTCHLSCSKCSGSTATDCLNCRSGYFLSAAGTCSVCPKGLGKITDVEFPYPSINADGTTACGITCDPTCQTCEGTANTECVMCAASYWWAGSGTCTICDVGKGIAANTSPLTAASNADSCSTCHTTCSKCKGTGATDCLNCKAGLYLASDGSCSVCPLGFGKIEDPVLPYPAASSDSGSTECGIVCHAKCATCSGTGETDCLSCNAGYFWAGAGVCTLCDPTTGKPADTILPSAVGTAALCTATCDASCSKCKGTGATDCLNCNPGYFLSAAGTCSMCPVGTGKLGDPELPYPAANPVGTAVCTIACDSTCTTCVGTAATDCLNCNAGYWWAGSGTCSSCLAGQGKPTDTAIVTAAASAAACTVTCDASCKICSGGAADECLSCKATYFKSAASICSPCTALKGKPADTTTVTAPTTASAACTDTCHVSCAKCSGPTANDCVTCSAGYFYSAAGVCSLCPTSKGKIIDSALPTVSLNLGVTECGITCHETCQTCAGTSSNQCTTCLPGRYWNNGQCTRCPSGKGKPADTNAFFAAEADTSCTSDCHPSCQMCKGPGETDCLSCSAGYWWAGEGTCTSCPVGRGKPFDTNLFPVAPGSAEACYIFCDICTSGCKTCTSEPTVCSTCVPGRLFQEGSCLQCPDNCLTCSSTETCTACEPNFVLSADGSTCSKCAVENCQTCEASIDICTKCNDKYTLKSSTECFLTPTVTTPALTGLTSTTTPGLVMDIINDNLSFDLGPTESKTVSAIFVVDKLANKKYTCEELRCNHFSTSKGISVKFDSDVTIQQGKLTIERVDPTVTKKIIGNRHKRVLLEAYPLVIDNFVLMGKSNLKTFSYVVKIIVSILRLPLSLLVFWKYPRWSMLMDFMVTHLKVYSLLGEPYMAFVEVVFQVVSDSKILPFNFNNPFEKWNPDTLTCSSRPALNSKNVQCSFFDNYGENIIGLASLAVLLLIIHYIGKYLSQRQGLSSKQRYLVDTLANGYGYQFFIAKLDANHLEIILFTIISYSTADASSKSVVGIIFSTAGLAGFLYLAGFLTWESVGVWNARPLQRGTTSKNQRNQHMVVQDTENDALGQRNRALPEPNTPPVQITEKVSLPVAVIFSFAGSLFPKNKLSIWLHAGRYLRAILLAIFVGVVKNPVEQIVLVIILEAIYLAHLLLLDYRGTLYERITQVSFQGLILLHLIFRSIATSNGLSEEQIHSVLSTMIAVVLIVYIVAHIILALLSLAALFIGTKESEVKEKAQEQPQNKLQVIEQGPDMVRNDNESKHQQAQPRSEMNFSYALPRQEIQSPQNFSVRSPVSYVDVDIPDEDKPERTIRPESAQLGFVDSGPTGLAPKTYE